MQMPAIMANAEGLGRVALYSIIFFCVSISLFQLGIGEQIVGAVFIIAFGARALALALAFGLDGRDAAAEYLKKWLGGKKLPAKQSKNV